MQKKLLDYLKKHSEVTKVIYSTEHDKPIAIEQNNILKGGNGPWLGLN